MLRFIDLRGQIDVYHDDKPLEEQRPHFAFFDTVTDTFIEINGSQEWTRFEDFVGDLERSDRWVAQAERMCALMPEWARRVKVDRSALTVKVEGFVA